jgi:hypothetical protein
MKELNNSYRDELRLLEPFDLLELLGNRDSRKYDLPRCLIESVAGGSHRFLSKGTIARVRVPGPGGVETESVQDNRSFEGWRKVK